MKHIYFIIATLVIACTSLNAQNDAVKLKKSMFEGIWQACSDVTVENGQAKINTYGLAFKSFSNGEFQNVRFLSGTAYISGYGTYKIKSDTEYVEHVQKATYSPINNTDVVISVTFLTNDVFKAQYKISGEDYTEYWAQIRMPIM